MAWLQVETTTGLSDPQALEDTLLELGAVSVSLRDAGDEPLLEPAPGDTPLWSQSIVSALFPAEMAAAELDAVLAAALPEQRFRVTAVADRDWQASYRQTLQRMQFGDRLWVVPEGATAPPEAIAVTLEPGMAFGSGEHPTTAMCLTWLTGQQLTGCAVLDYGCGSGLLAIAALALGARAATGVDIDPQALTASRENALRNGCAERFAIAKPEAMEADKQYDVLVANILSGILIELGPALRQRMKPGAPLALTGILADQAQDVAAAWEDWADLKVTDRQGDWVLLSGNRRG